jgi:hypothetical protein
MILEVVVGTEEYWEELEAELQFWGSEVVMGAGKSLHELEDGMQLLVLWILMGPEEDLDKLETGPQPLELKISVCSRMRKSFLDDMDVSGMAKKMIW